MASLVTDLNAAFFQYAWGESGLQEIDRVLSGICCRPPLLGSDTAFWGQECGGSTRYSNDHL